MALRGDRVCRLLLVFGHALTTRTTAEYFNCIARSGLVQDCAVVAMHAYAAAVWPEAATSWFISVWGESVLTRGGNLSPFLMLDAAVFPWSASSLCQMQMERAGWLISACELLTLIWVQAVSFCW